MHFPRILLVRQKFPDRRLADVSAEVRQQMAASGFAQRLQPGARVAIGVGSRGIHNLATIAREVVAYWNAQGMRPFIFPAMGSHGAATAEGQADVLAHYGIIEQTMGCPIVSQLEVVSLGKTADGIEAFMDRTAYESDAVMLVSRVKWHTDFEGRLESGLFKMTAIGLGKFAGARRYHTHAYTLGLEHVIRSVGRLALATGKVIGGLAILEDAYHNTARITAIPAATMERQEEEELALVKSWMAKLPMPLDVLIVDEIGKNISGAGMDTKVINRSIRSQNNFFPYLPKFERIFVRNLSSLSYGNGLGIGLADVVTDRLLDQIDWTPTQVNALTASSPTIIRTPIHFPSDRECLERVVPTVGKLDLSEVTLGWIRNTMELAVLGLSENLKPEIDNNPLLEILGPAQEMEFDASGNLADLPVQEMQPAQVGR
jgi:hypothetical protein